jgi:hypothetical protein
MLYAFCEAGDFTDKWVKPGTFGYWFSQRFETSYFKFLGAQSVTISVKMAPLMHCFFCGALEAIPAALKKFDVPVCKFCEKEHENLVKLYQKKQKVSFAQHYIVDPPVLKPVKEQCSFCGNEYLTHELFEDFGFNRPVCTNCITKPAVNIILSCSHAKPVWRK